MLDFLGIGAQKAGTTWLSEMLSLHPEIAFPAGKEVHFWDMAKERDVDAYRALFNVPGKKNGEITPAYAILPTEIIAEIHQAFPEVPLFYSVRDPAQRAWSGALMALRRAEMQFEEASDAWFIDHFRSQGSRARGDYLGCLKRWLHYYPPPQLLLVRQSEIAAHPRAVMLSLAQHLGIDPGFYRTLPEATLSASVFAGEKHPIRPALMAELASLYAGTMEAFEAFAAASGVKTTSFP